MNNKNSHNLPISRKFSMEDVKLYLDSHFCEELNLDQLAQRFGYSKFYLSRCFTQQYGRAPVDYLIAVRLEEGRKLLTSTKLPVREIAHRVGFTHDTVFITRFRRTYGITPLQYRKTLRKK